MSQTGRWLTDLGLQNYIPDFERAEVAFSDLPHLTSEDLKEIGLPVGPRRRLLEAAKLLTVDTRASEPAAIPTAGPASAGRDNVSHVYFPMKYVHV